MSPLDYKLIQTDFPWSFINDLPTSGGNVTELPTNPARPFFERSDVDHSVTRQFDESNLTEPGYRMYLCSTVLKAQALLIVPAGTDTWETQASNTSITHDDQLPPQARPASTGYITMQSSAKPDRSYVHIGRIQLGDPSRTVTIRVIVGNEGDERVNNYTVPHQEPQPSDIGDLLRAVVKQGGGDSTVTLYTAGSMNADGTPHWNTLPDGTVSVHADLDMQGFAADGDILLVNPRHNGELVRPSDFTRLLPTPTNVVDLTFCRIDNTACVPRPQAPVDLLTSWDGATYKAVHEANGQVFGRQARHLYTNDRYEATTSGLTEHFADTKFVLRTDQPNGTWAPVFRCVDWRRDVHTYWLSTSIACDNSGDDPGQPNGIMGYISTVNNVNMAPLIHLRKGTQNATGLPTNTPEHDTHDHVFAVGLTESLGLQRNGYEPRETLGYVYTARSVVISP